MPILPCPLTIDSQNRETDRRGTPLFPCGGYVTSVGDRLDQGISWHWHEEVEALVVKSGTLALELMEQRFRIAEGEGAFINSGVLQSAVAADGSACEIHSLVFHPGLIAGLAQGAVEQRYVRPLLGCGQIPGIHFQRGILWHQEAIGCILDAFCAYQGEAFGYELLVWEKLSHLWYLVVSNHRDLIGGRPAVNPDQNRLKVMLAFLHANYANPVTLSEIAREAAVSERECLRCFRRTIGQTPMQYLLGYRVSVAAKLLAESGQSITEICRLAGFESPSYFSLQFKKRMGMTPREYRAAHAPKP